MGSGAPNTAITPSPANLSMVPPCSMTMSAMAARCRPRMPATSRAGSCSARVEKPRMSEKSTVTSSSSWNVTDSPEASRSANWAGTKDRKVRAEAAAQQGQRVGLVVMGRKDDHARAGEAATDLVGAVDALELEVRGHLDVRDHHVWPVLVGGGHQRGRVVRHAHDLDAVGRGEK